MNQSRGFVTSIPALKEANQPPPPVKNEAPARESPATVPPSPPASGSTPSQPSNKYWWLFAVAAVAGGGAMLYKSNSTDTPQDIIPVALPKRSTTLTYKVRKLINQIKSNPITEKIPESSLDIPKEIPYLLIGGGTASFAAFRAIKSHDPKAKVSNFYILNFFSSISLLN